jgi:hypothetical protein
MSPLLTPNRPDLVAAWGEHQEAKIGEQYQMTNATDSDSGVSLTLQLRRASAAAPPQMGRRRGTTSQQDARGGMKSDSLKVCVGTAASAWSVTRDPTMLTHDANPMRPLQTTRHGTSTSDDPPD